MVYFPTHWLFFPGSMAGTTLFCFYFILFFLFMAAPVAQGRSQARGQIRVAAEAYITAVATLDPSCISNLHCSFQHHRIFNPLSEARDGTRILVDSRWICFCCATTGTPRPLSFICCKTARKCSDELRIEQSHHFVCFGNQSANIYFWSHLLNQRNLELVTVLF